MLIQLIAAFLRRTQYENTTCWISTATHSGQPLWHHIIMQLFQKTYSSTRCLFTLQVADSFTPDKQASPIFTWEEISTGGPAKTQASNTYEAYRHRRKQIYSLSQSFLHLWTLVFCFPSTYLPISLPLSVLFLCCFFFFFLPLAKSDAINTSRVIQVWLSVSVDWQPSQMMQMWSKHGKLELSR